MTAAAAHYFPSLTEITPPSWDHLISPLELRLPKSVLANAQSAIEAFYAISRRPAYAQQLEPIAEISDFAPPYQSLLMAYDFHTTESGECHLVEINTNASGYLLTTLLEMTHSDTRVEDSPQLARLQASFAAELAAWGKAGPHIRIAITDEEIAQQKMYVEFLMYKDWLRSCGWNAELVESRDFVAAGPALQNAHGDRIDLVYNRLTDFYLQSPQHASLRAGYVGGAACVSPSPREYWLLADKQRLIQFTSSDFLQAVGATPEEIASVQRVLIPTFEKSAFASPEAIWLDRRRLFFKPKRSYGGKSVYRGESVSRKVFERLMHEDILIQQFTPAQKMPTEDPRSVLSNWKFDLRFFVYGNQVQHAVARIYQGQVTNFASPLGGFTRVMFV